MDISYFTITTVFLLAFLLLVIFRLIELYRGRSFEIWRSVRDRVDVYLDKFYTYGARLVVAVNDVVKQVATRYLLLPFIGLLKRTIRLLIQKLMSLLECSYRFLLRLKYRRRKRDENGTL